MVEHHKSFIELSAPSDDNSEEMVLSQFINGLTGHIEAEIRLHEPPNLDVAMDLALKIEDKSMFDLRSTNTKSQTPKSGYGTSPFNTKSGNLLFNPIQSITKTLQNTEPHLLKTPSPLTLHKPKLTPPTHLHQPWLFPIRTVQ